MLSQILEGTGGGGKLTGTPGVVFALVKALWSQVTHQRSRRKPSLMRPKDRWLLRPQAGLRQLNFPFLLSLVLQLPWLHLLY